VGRTSGGERTPDAPHDTRRIVVELGPGDVTDDPSGDAQLGVTDRVRFESLVGEMILLALAFDADPELRIGHIDPEPPPGCDDPVLQLGLRKAGVDEELTDRVLE
jgi:hypothetical protein